jgi:hypothetical protein
MFSLRQCANDFDVDATLELIGSIGCVHATANDGYFTRAFCLLEAYGEEEGGIHFPFEEWQALAMINDIKMMRELPAWKK